MRQRERRIEQPEWHQPWVNFRVISGHLGWVRCVAVDPSNEWFATGSADRTIKVGDTKTNFVYFQQCMSPFRLCIQIIISCTLEPDITRSLSSFP